MRREALLVFAVVLAIGVPARAAGAPVVAADGAVALHAHRSDHRLCLRVTGAETDALGHRGCETPPRSPYAPIVLDAFGGAGVLAIAVAPQVATVEVAGVRHDTVTATGFSTRFLVVARPGAVGLLRFYDAAGTLIGAATRDGDTVRVRGSRYGISRRGSVHLDGTLEPTPLEPDRVVTRTCLTLRARRTSSQGECLAPGEQALVTNVAATCGASASFGGLAQPRVRYVLARLGSGRRLPIRTYPLPGRFGLRAFTRAIPRGEAIRSATAYGRRGRVLARRAVGEAPTGLPCAAQDAGASGIFGILVRDDGSGPAGTPETLGERGGHRLLIADGSGTALCGGFDRLDGSDCGPPPVDGSSLFLQRRGRAVGGLVSGDTAHVDLRLDDGTRLGADTAAAVYAGAYSGTVRFALLEIPAGRTVAAVVARTASGARLGTGTVFHPARTRVVRRGRAGRQRYAVVRRDYGDDGGARVSCLRIRRTLATVPLCAGFPAPFATVSVSAACRPQRVVLSGSLPATVRRVALVLGDGTEQPATTVRLTGGRVWLARVGPAATVRALHFYGRLPTLDRHLPRPLPVQPLQVPPPGRQCGYGDLRTATRTAVDSQGGSTGSDVDLALAHRSARNSARVRASSRNRPRRADVVVRAPGF